MDFINSLLEVLKESEEENNRIAVGYRTYEEVLSNLGDESWSDWLAEEESRTKRAAA